MYDLHALLDRLQYRIRIRPQRIVDVRNKVSANVHYVSIA